MLIGVGALILVGGLLFDVLRPHVFSGAVLQSSEPAPEMSGLAYDDGEPVDIAGLRGDVVLIYFGYTHCPDLCPTMLSTVNRAIEELNDDAERVHTLMVTVDPERDSPELLDEYVGHFNDSFRGVWGDVETVRSVASTYGVHFEYDEPLGNNYLVGHTASLMLIDPEGVLRIVYPTGIEAGDLEEDLEELLA
jgi:protein SCO1/2